VTAVSSIGLYCLCGETVQMMAQAEPELEPLFSSYTKMKDAVTTSRTIKVTFECFRCGEVDVVGSRGPSGRAGERSELPPRAAHDLSLVLGQL
jgi:hypothetical protein